MRSPASLASLLPASVCAAGEPDPLADCGGAAAHGFEFRLGTWIVHTADGACAGENRITREPGSCRIDEAWTGARGGSGRSVNFLDPVPGRWSPWFEGFYTRMEEGGAACPG